MTALAATMKGWPSGTTLLLVLALAAVILIGIGCVVWQVCRHFSKDERMGFPVRPRKG